MLRTCRECKIEAKTEKDLVLFVNDKSCKHNKKQLCVDCHRDSLRTNRYGIEKGIYKEILIKQNHSCAICGSKDSGSTIDGLHLDHCHSTGQIRGILCKNCNNALGMFFDDTKLLEKAIQYLNRSQAGLKTE